MVVCNFAPSRSISSVATSPSPSFDGWLGKVRWVVSETSNSSSLAVNRERWACPWAARTPLGSTFSLSQNRYVPFTDAQSSQAFGIDSEGASPRARPICWSRSVSRLSPKSAVRNSALIDPGVPRRREVVALIMPDGESYD